MTVVGKPKPKPLEGLNIRSQGIDIGDAGAPEVGDDTDSYYDEYEDEDEYQEPISWAGLLEIDTLIYPTMKGTLEIDQDRFKYSIYGTLILPDGKAVFTDEFEMIVSQKRFNNRGFLCREYAIGANTDINRVVLLCELSAE